MPPAPQQSSGSWRILSESYVYVSRARVVYETENQQGEVA